MNPKGDSNNIILILPSLSAGGMERVMIQLSKEFVDKFRLNVYLILLTKNKQFYKVPEKVKIIEPKFNYKNYNRIYNMIKTIFFIRKYIASIDSKTVLSFGGKYNAFVLLSSIGLNVNIYVSDRSRPGISYGKFLDLLNPILYKKAAGIIAQTESAKQFAIRSTKHERIKVIGNPIRKIEFDKNERKENIILNVGRFIKSKHQEWLINYFIELGLENWKLIFLGDGPMLDSIRNLPQVKLNSDRIIFKGNVENIDYYYNKSRIFAFTSTSEGFPNALGEAMKAGLACISYNCHAGASDIIDHSINGFLIDVEEHEDYKIHLGQLCEDNDLIENFGKQAKIKMKKFDSSEIALQFLNFCLGK